MKKTGFTAKAGIMLAAASLALALTGCPGTTATTQPVTPEVEPGTVGEFPEAVQDAATLVKTLDANDGHVILFWYDSSVASADKYGSYCAYNWVPNGSGDDNKNAMPVFESNSDTGIGYVDFTENIKSLSGGVKELIEAGKDFNFIIREISDWNKKTGDETFPLSGGKHVIYIGGDIYTISDNMSATISGAAMETLTTMKVQLGVKYGLETSASSNGFTLTADDGSSITITDAVNYNAQDDRSKNNTSAVLLTLGSKIDTSKVWTLKHEKFGEKNVATAAVVAEDIGNVSYSGDDLGLTLTENGTKATFKVWAPVASEVKVLLYKTVEDVGTYNEASVALNVPGALTDGELLGTVMENGTIDMKKDAATGVWSASGVDVSDAKYYKYQIKNGAKTYYVCDIYAKSASPDSIASQIVDINSATEAKPTGVRHDTTWGTGEGYYNPFKGTTYNEAVIYEMHVRDWSRAVTGGSTGRFKEVADDKIIAHLTDLGVTHVQILPMFDYAQVNSDKNYNWGYNPFHYNVPEGRYVDYTNNPDGTAAVEQMREMIAKLHDAGIAVIMDVVFNHTSGTGAGSLYDSTVPYYYYRMNSDGTYSNGSGCGNETNSEAPMFKKYMIDSLKHWMLDYHINGFRFDLMGLHSAATMEEIGAALKEIDSSVLVYGEPWTGGTSPVSNSATAAGNNYGAFDDDYRDAIKGAEFGGFNAGQVQVSSFTKDTKTGVSYSDNGITNGIVGKSGDNNRNKTSYTGHALHYAECHDNFTLYDKLVYSLDIDGAKTADGNGKIATVFPKTALTEDQLELVKAQDKLAAAFVILSQGTPFLNGGQEFLRTKKGDPDSYAADTKGGVTWTNEAGEYNIDDVNTIDLSFKTTYSDVYNTYKALIALRKSSSAFTAPTRTTAKKVDSTKGVTLYEVTNGADTYDVYFNVNTTDHALKTAVRGKAVTLSEADGSVATANSESELSSIPAKSFVVIKK